LFEVERKLDWCWFCDLTSQFIYDKNLNNWTCVRCGKDLRHSGRTMEEDVPWENKDELMDMGVCKSYQREHPRFIVELPFDYSLMDWEGEYGGIATNVSQGGLLVYVHEFIEKGTLLRIVMLSVKGSECNTIKVMAKAVWGDLAAKAPWGKHRYGLKFESFNRGSLDRFKILLREVLGAHAGQEKWTG
jgi:hypothetical protein